MLSSKNTVAPYKLVQDINNESFLCCRLTSIVLAHSFKLLVKASKYILNSDIWYALQYSAFLSVACL